MSNSNFITNKRNLNAQASINNTNSLVRALQETLSTTGQDFTPTFSNVTLTGKTTAYQLDVVDRTTLKDVNITGTVTGLTLNGVVTDTRFNSYTSDLSTRLNSIEAYASTTRANAESSNITVTGRVSLLESGLAAAKTQTDKVPGIESNLQSLNQTVGSSTGGLVKDNQTFNNVTVPNLADARARLSVLEQTVNGVDVTTGLSNNVTNLQSRTTVVESGVNALYTEVHGVNGLKARVSSVETNLTNLDSELNAKILNLIGEQVPEQFDTLREIADQLNSQLDGSVLNGVLSQINSKANSADALIKGIEAAPGENVVSVIQRVYNPVQFNGDVTGVGLKAVNISAVDEPSVIDSTSVAAKLKNRVTLDSAQEIIAPKTFKNTVLLQNTDQLLFGTSSANAESLTTKLSKTTISSTQNFENGLTVPTFDLIKITTGEVNGGQALGTEVYSRLDTRASAGQPEVNSKPVFKEGCRLLDTQKVVLGNSANPTIADTLFAVVDRTLTNQTNIANLNSALAGYASLSGSQTFQSGTKTFDSDAYLLMDPSNLVFRSPVSDTTFPPVSLTTLLGRDRVMYLTGTDTQTIEAAKKFTGNVQLYYDGLTLNRVKDSVPVTLNAKDFLLNVLDNQNVSGVKTFTGLGGASFESGDQLKIAGISLPSYAVTVTGNTSQRITGPKHFDAEVRVSLSNLKLIDPLMSTDTSAETYIVNTAGAQSISGKKDFSAGNGLVVAPSTLFFQTDATTQYTGTDYLVNRVDAQTVAGKKSFTSGVILPMDTSELKVSAGDLSSVLFKDYVASKTASQTIAGATTFSTSLLVDSSKLSFPDLGKTFADFSSVSNLVYVSGEQSITGKKKFTTAGTLEVDPSALSVKDASVNGGAPLASTAYFMSLYGNQSVAGTKDFGLSGQITISPANLQIKATAGSTAEGADAYFVTASAGGEQTISADKKVTGKLTVEASKLTIGSTTFADWLSTSNVMYLGGAQTVSGTKSFTGSVDVDGSQFKVRRDNTVSAASAPSIYDAFVYTEKRGDTYQEINGNKKIQCFMDFPKDAAYKIRIPIDQLELYTVGDPFSQIIETVDLSVINTKVNSTASSLLALQTSFGTYSGTVDTIESYRTNYFDKNLTSQDQVVQSVMKIPAANLMLTGNSGASYYSASTFLRTGVSNDLTVSGTGLRVNAADVTLPDYTGAPTLFSKFTEFTPLKSDAEVTFDSVTSNTPSTLTFSNNKRLNIYKDNILIRTSASDPSTTKLFPDYFNSSYDTRLDFHTNTNYSTDTSSKQLVSKKDLAIKFDAGTDSNKQTIEFGTNTTVKIASDANLLIGPSSTLSSLLSNKLDVLTNDTYLKTSIATATYATQTSLGNYLQVAGGSITNNLSIGGTLGVTGASTFSSTVALNNTATATRIIEKFATTSVTGGTSITINLGNAAVFVVTSALTGNGTVTINSTSFSSTSVNDNQSHSFSVLFPFQGTSTTKYYFTTVSLSGDSSMPVIIAGGSTNVDLTLTNAGTTVGTCYVLQTFTIFKRPAGTATTGNICLSSVALFV